MAQIIDDLDVGKLKKKKTVLAGGCFDILHIAHKEFLRKAKKLGGELVVLLESDENVKKMKGEKRPLNTQSVRAENLSKLSYTDFIVNLKVPKDSQYYYNLVKLIHPDIIAVTKNDPLISIKKDQAEMVGGKVVEVMDRDKKHSTTSMINKRT